ncbi:lipopolysaccharide biosynthesis protein [Dietzia cercidiphylli]|uniref:lipopolysaccharide biosynthesis protein n=1 Tax=Dietzia cercidiphylli TaxID=498199 RepID=UPI00223AB2AA|nr:hypothetical protein [Dietzia cercidiphylli]MCT1516949.1 hypothetical protein [Dietzia cercidiphylli]
MSEKSGSNWGMGAARRLLHSSPVQASVIRIFSIVIGVLSSVVMARWGGAAVKGEFSTFVAVTSIVFAVVNLDIAQQIIRVGRESRDQSRILAWSIRPWSIYTIVALSVLVPFSFIDSSVSWIVAGALAVTLATQAGTLLNAVSGTVSLAFQALFQQVVLLVGSVALGLLNSYSTASVYGLAIFASVAALLYALPGIRPKPGVRNKQMAPRLRDLVRAGAMWQPLRVGQMALHKGDLLLVYLLAGPSAAGVYSVAISLSSLSSILPQQISQHVLFLGANNRNVSMARSILSALGFGLFAAGLLAVACVPLISLLYGPDFEEASGAVFASLPGAVAIPIFQIVCNHYRLRGSARLPALGATLGTVVMVIVTLLSFPFIGIVGAGIAFSAGSIVAATFLVAMYRLVRFSF